MDQDVLSQDEIDALLTGVDSGDVETSEAVVDDDGVRPYDLASQDRVVRGRLPTLEVIGERFARYLRHSLYNMLRFSVEVGVGGVQIIKYGEYVHTLYVPTSMNIIRMRPMMGYGLIVLDAKLIFTLVDQYFGGVGKQVKIEGREFTATENRIVHRLLETIFRDLSAAWKNVLPVNIEYFGSEVNPSLVNAVNPNEAVVVKTFRLDFGGEGGEVHVALPYSMLEPFKKLLDSTAQAGEDEVDREFSPKLQRQLLEAEVPLESRIVERTIALSDLLNLKAGDVLPVDFEDIHLVTTSRETPVFKARLGESRGKLAFEVEALHEEP